MGERRAVSRLASGIAGLDVILRGGFFQGGIYILSGRPGAGKTILANQVAFAHARQGGRVVYATLLAETHGRLLANLSALAFFDETIVGRDVVYLNGLAALTDDGLTGLMNLTRTMVRDQKATLLVLDGMVTASQVAKSEMDYQRFISELQSWVSVHNCTVLFVTSSASANDGGAEHTMVDGIMELAMVKLGVRDLREISVRKFRGSAYLMGRHTYLISDAGITVYPRIEVARQPSNHAPSARRVTTGVPGLDDIMGGGGVVEGSTTLLFGSSGSGKTIAGLQFLDAGARKGEPCLYFGFYEPPQSIIAKAERLGLDFEKYADSGKLRIEWRRPAEAMLDEVASFLLETVERHGTKRVFVDGFVGFKSASNPERISAVFSTVADALTAARATTMISDEARELFVRDIHVPTPNVSAIFHNIVFLRYVEQEAELARLLSVMKTRDSGHDARLWRTVIDESGIRCLAPFTGTEQSLMMGTTTMPRPKRTRRPRKRR